MSARHIRLERPNDPRGAASALFYSLAICRQPRGGPREGPWARSLRRCEEERCKRVARSKALPGPGAYVPRHERVLTSAYKATFGNSTREDAPTKHRNLSQPGPGAYNLQDYKKTGSEAPKFSAVPRRRIIDVQSYTTPGPGSYNTHMTSFG
eukprot:TRINITY_DN11463_c0_g1_i10.p2 TRINITY_DN11463_c0_g1~~TRINITY_DN11463_c0_g1_i10.p2  ORF type:complete len:152 (-),score=20.41 TRINITY_DN11463_c0_g1_i10:277-732(-)